MKAMKGVRNVIWTEVIATIGREGLPNHIGIQCFIPGSVIRGSWLAYPLSLEAKVYQKLHPSLARRAVSRFSGHASI
ncbi:MAG: hypothetical protein ACYCPW_02890 [Nitrososphaerales archaeon]